MEGLSFSLLLLDECSQMTEPASLLPMARYIQAITGVRRGGRKGGVGEGREERREGRREGGSEC